MSIDRTVLSDGETGGLGRVELLHAPGSPALTPASRIAIWGIGANQHLLAGIGLDWGSGTGCLAIVAARITAVSQVIGLEILPRDVDVARQNAVRNGVASKVTFFLADSYTPLSEADRQSLANLQGQIKFILANPPASEGDDGFGYRRLVLRDARPFLASSGVVFLSISAQYGLARIERLSQDAPGFVHGGVLASTEPVPFDLRRPDLQQCLQLYAAEEERSGLKYTFAKPESPDQAIDARTALARFRRTGLSPLTCWQTHLFRYMGATG